MSTQLIVHCDRCHERITHDRSALIPKCGPIRRRGSEPIDLCSTCADELNTWIGPANGQPADAPRTTIVSEHTRRIRANGPALEAAS